MALNDGPLRYTDGNSQGLWSYAFGERSALLLTCAAGIVIYLVYGCLCSTNELMITEFAPADYKRQVTWTT